MSIEVSKHLLIFIMYKMKTYDKSIEVLSIGEMQKISGGKNGKPTGVEPVMNLYILQKLLRME